MTGATFFHVPQALLDQLPAASVKVHEVLKFVQQFVEQLNIIGKIIQQTLNNRLDLLPQGVTLVFTPWSPANTGHGQLVQQFPRRMPAAVKKAAVEQCHLEHRNLQPADQKLHQGRQLAIVQNELKQHRYQIDHITINLVHRQPLIRTLGQSTTQQDRQRQSLTMVAGQH